MAPALKGGAMKVELKLKRYHPRGSMRLGRHFITREFQEFDLNEVEDKELKGECGKHWFEVKAYECVKEAKEFDKPKEKVIEKPKTKKKIITRKKK